uniref:ZnMc domain-containing protein n=1 Tax=Steinernema glaseri TaxID=37863 RepID=A0A1I7ZI23_9BILA
MRLAILLFSLSLAGAARHRPRRVVDATHYLTQFGYLDSETNVGRLPDALRRFQEFAHLPVTGRVDRRTARKMRQKRCGNEDVVLRAKRYALEGSYWGVKNLTYRITKRSSSLPDFVVRRVLKKAFRVWEANSPLRFQERTRGQVHIEFVFARGRHGDGEPFDGKGHVLAHAFFPRFGGDVHLDDDEYWTPSKSAEPAKMGPLHNFNRDQGVDLYAVVTHEIGHSLGLKHSQNENAIMAPFYQTYSGDSLRLHSDDIKALNALYGPTPKTVTAPKTPDICDDATIDAITVLGNGTTYAFRGEFYWRLNPSGNRPTPPARRIVEDWPGLEAGIDAVLTDNDGDTYVFRGDKYWLLDRDGRVYKGYPRKISIGLVSTPSDLDAAFVWSQDDKPYFFKNDKFWRYSRWGMSRGWPRSVASLFRGVLPASQAPRKIDAALRTADDRCFVFVGSKYFRLQDWRHFKVADGYPRSTAADWFGCPSKKN